MYWVPPAASAPAKAPISPAFANGDELVITWARAPDYCLAVYACEDCGSHSCCCDSGGPICSKINDGHDERQRWRLVDNALLQNVASGKFLTTPTKYEQVSNVDEPWQGNFTELKVRERSQVDPDSQRWVLTTESVPDSDGTTDSVSVLRHFKDGRAVETTGWQFAEGHTVGVCAVHSDCAGCSILLQSPEQAIAAAEEARSRSIVLSGAGTPEVNGEYIWNPELPPLSEKLRCDDGIYVHEHMNGWCVLSADFMSLVAVL